MRISNHVPVWKTGADHFLELLNSDLNLKRNLDIESYNDYWTRFIAKNRDLSVSYRDILVTSKSRHFAIIKFKNC